MYQEALQVGKSSKADLILHGAWPRFHHRGHCNRVFLVGDIWYKLIEGSLEVKLPTIWTDEKQSREEAERRERLEERRVEEKE